MHVAEYLDWHDPTFSQQLHGKLGAVDPLRYDEMVRAPLVASDGIPFQSDRAAAELTDGIDFAYRPCPFRDSPSRYPDGQPHDVPISGLEQRRFVSRYNEVLDFTATMRDMIASPKRGDGPRTFGESLMLLGTLRYLPHYVVFRSRDHVEPDQIDPLLTITANSASGAMASLHAVMQMNPQVRLDMIPDSPAAIAHSEALGTMVGEKTVCVASPRMMVGFLDTVIHGRSEQHEPSPLSAELDRVGIEKAAAFGGNMMMIDSVLLETVQEDKTLMDRHRTMRASHARAARQKGPSRAKLVKSTKQELATMADTYTKRFTNTMQDLRSAHQEMNRALGRDTDPRLPLELMQQLPLYYAATILGEPRSDDPQ